MDGEDCPAENTPQNAANAAAAGGDENAMSNSPPDGAGVLANMASALQNMAAMHANSPSNHAARGLSGMGHNMNPRGQSSSAANHNQNAPSNHPQPMRVGDDDGPFYPPLAGDMGDGMAGILNL